MQNIDNFVAVEKIIFYGFSLLAILAAFAVVLAKNSVHAVLFLILSFFATAVLWMTLQAEFLSIILILVYVGAVMVLFLFVVMMLDVDITTLKEGFTRYLPIGIFVSIIMIGSLVYAYLRNFGQEYHSLTLHTLEYSSIKTLGELLYTQYLYPLEIAGILLLVAIIAAISLTQREREGLRTPKPTEQIEVNKKQRLAMVKITRESPVFQSITLKRGQE